VALSPDSSALNPYAAPKSRLEEIPAAGAAWRDGKLVRFKHQGALPDRCVVCNADARGARVGRKLYCSPLAWRLGAVAAPFVSLWLGVALDADLLIVSFWPLVVILLVANFFVRKSLEVELGICARHRKLRGALTVASLLSMGAVLFGIFASLSTGTGWTALLGGAAGLFAFAIAERFIGVQAVSLRKLSDEDAWLGGTGKAFREALPGLTG
jgi:hypothetical protein